MTTSIRVAKFLQSGDKLIDLDRPRKSDCLRASYRGAIYYIKSEQVIAFSGWVKTAKGSIHRRIKQANARGIPEDYWMVKAEEFEKALENML